VVDTDAFAQGPQVKPMALQLLKGLCNRTNRMNFQETVEWERAVQREPDEVDRTAALPPTSSSQVSGKPDFEVIVDQYYRPLYQFAFSLTRSETDACDLAQQTFLTWSAKGDQLRDPSKVRSWLFTTLHRAFLETKRRQTRFPHCELDEFDKDIPDHPPLGDSRLDAFQALEALEQLDEIFRAPVALFYLEDCPYQEIAEVLGIPLGTVKSRIARGISHLQKALSPPPRILEPTAVQPRHNGKHRKPASLRLRKEWLPTADGEAYPRTTSVAPRCSSLFSPPRHEF
jgi:RNA polymerase sigma-70 factor, ECF subfamily